MNNTPDWTLLRAFLETAQTGSLSAAARRLGLTQPTLSRQVAALEDATGLMLFERVGRGLALTEAGRELLPHARRMGEAAERLSFSVTALGSDLSGPVRISASYAYAAYLLPGFLGRIKQAAPRIHPEIIASDDISDLMRREADIAVRHLRPEEPELVARLVFEARGHFYAAPALLARQGRPDTKEALAAMDWVGFGDDTRFLSYAAELGIPLQPSAFQASSENGITAWEMAKAGLGVCAMEESIAALSPEMEPLLASEIDITFPVWLVTHREIHTSPRIRLVFDMLAEAFSAR
ncbi:LysR family transcriptional regulator [Rhodobacteraceae bacterium 63075]|nr:LysR family transcriptional regulator [Rhodobacteraceae bacterium 63075]